MKTYKLLVLGVALSTLAIALCVRMPQTVEAQGNTPKDSVPVAVFQAAGPNAASIQSAVDAFRAALGDPNGNAAGPLASGRREINWDGGGGVDATTAPVTPFNVFLNTPRRSVHHTRSRTLAGASIWRTSGWSRGSFRKPELRR